MIGLLGLIGSICFSISALPQAWHSYRLGRTNGISDLFLGLWATGEICTLLYVGLTTRDPYLLSNYVINGICLSVIIRYRILPRR